MFKSVDSKVNFVDLENKILKFWKDNNILKTYLCKNDKSERRFRFLDGPITANNPMGVHHGWGRTLKDLYQRYKNMQGYRQRFQNGFDNQGLWVEVEVEKKLGFKSKKDIENYGIDRFVEECKKHTLHFAQVQSEQSQKLGYFMDWGNDYYTMSNENNYTIWYFLKKVWQDGNLYKGRDSVPWCPRCGTAISQHEILSEEYKELIHRSVVFKLPVKGNQKKFLLAWTTTPWTIPGNAALVVDPKISYWEMVDPEGEKVILVNPAMAKDLEKEASLVRDHELTNGWRKIKELKGEDLVGLEYYPPYCDLPAVKQALGKHTLRVIASEPQVLEVNPAEGTGIVHMAPGAGTEDFRMGEKEGIPAIEEIDETGVFLPGFGFIEGLSVEEASLKILKDLNNRGLIFKEFDYTHRYPTCWRCKSELVWRVVDEWYIAMDDARKKGAKNYRQALKKVIKNVNWIPEFGYDRELDWLNNMEDWLISKKRYWGLALPIWECNCGHFTVIGSIEELEEKSVAGWEKFEGHTPHRPWIDEVKVKCSSCGKIISRIADVGNPWLDAGIVSFSTYLDPKTGQVSYLADKKYWQQWYPADFVTECFPGQFKNWFYSLLAMSTVLENKAPFRILLGHGTVKDEKGEEMHKSKGNAIWFDDALENMGADTMRWMYVLQNPAYDLRFGYTIAAKIKRQFLLMFWNCYKFFGDYARVEGIGPNLSFNTKDLSVLDRWILSRFNRLVKLVTEKLDSYDHPTAVRNLEDFVVNDLSTWYIRRSRSRIGPSASGAKDKKVCYAVLHHILLDLTKLLAPFIPFLSEEIYQNLKTKNVVSVHLEGWPKIDEKFVDENLETTMNLARNLVEQAHSLRREKGIKIRQPLSTLVYSWKERLPKDLEDIVADEVNVKKIKFEKVKKGISLENPEILSLDFKLTKKLKLEGIAREMVREIQEARKLANCQLDEKIIATYKDNQDFREAAAKYEDYIKHQTLSKKIKPGASFSVERSKK